MPSIRVKRGTRAQINAAATASGLKDGEVYLITDEARLAVGTAVNAYQASAKQGEGGAGSTLKGSTSINVPFMAYEHTQTVAVTGATGASVAMVSLGAHLDTDENHESMIDLDALMATAGTDQITITALFREPTSGPVRINYMVA